MEADTNPGNPLDLAANGGARWLAFLRFLAFTALSIGLVVVFTLVLQQLGETAQLSVSNVAIVQIMTAGVIVGATGIMISATREPATYFGWGKSERLRQFGIGAVSGLGLITAMLGVMTALGGVSFGPPTLNLTTTIANAVIFGVIFILTAISEEGLLRGYGFVQLARAISFWPAAIASSVIFAALHLGNASETPMGVGAVVLVGVVLAYSFRRSGALWFAWGYHAAWDFAESFIYGVPDSGVVMPGALLAPSFHGSDWLTGGSAGPEGSLLIVPALALLAVIAHFTLRRAVSR
jgi:membrane protease YdiL (CAAX protease family)